MMLSLYQGVMTLGAPAIELFLSRRVERGKEDRQRLCERRGVAGLPRPDGELIWLHASSVGESVAALVLIQQLLEAAPNRHVLVTTGTVTSARMMASRLPDRAFHQFVPVDRPAWVRRFLDHWRPDLALIMESEFWPAQLVHAHTNGIPIVLINARMSDRSFSRWRLAGPLARPLFSIFDLVLATNADQASRFTALGAARVQISGNLKQAARALPFEPDAAALSDQIAGRMVWFAASTHTGEDAPVLDAHLTLRDEHPGLLAVIAPRHPHRGPEIAAMARERGLAVALRSAGEPVLSGTDLYIADTLGEMALFFHIADIVFVAGSLVPVGGHNPAEPAHFNAAILFGPLMSKNTEIASEMTDREAAIRLTGAGDLAPTVDALLKDQARRDLLAQNARRYVEDGAGILEAILENIAPYLADHADDHPADHPAGPQS
ncbi:MAG: 3-deoxy-D-manno-octulosonic acid transferase [Proteobacteria bacterium]|nr:3-deoxy-D-manno-octulosonic acid transferase [Pseudomonadota bacterium]MDA1309445.1 3-deoxy-D-manno-octulosonic acid transferase [Pseudomonadota bacterium]